MMIKKLNDEFGMDRALTFEDGPGGLILAHITSKQANATVALHGAHVLSYTPAGHEDLLWLSRDSIFAPGEPIRGGIPICWPWFGAHPEHSSLPAHGFARRRQWEVESTSELDDGAIQIRLALRDDEESRQIWPHPFELTAQVTVGAKLRLELTMHNPGPDAYTITAALHSYFCVRNIADVVIHGLDGCTYIDTVGGANSRHKQNGAITINEEVDRIYLDTTADVLIDTPSRHRRLRVAKEGSLSTVVWNPWIAKAVRMPDFGNDEYGSMVCVESANNANDVVKLAPGASHTTTTIISAETLG